MTKKLYILAILISHAIIATAHTGTQQFIDKVVDHLTTADGITAQFTLRGDIDSGIVMQGSLKMRGEKFYLKTNDMTTWYDGKTMWSYAKVVDEVNVTEPTTQELIEVNPYLLLKNYKSLFDITEVTSSHAGERRFKLTPLKRNTNIEELYITIVTATLSPIAFDITTQQGDEMQIVITQYDSNTPLPADTFTFDSKQLPGVDIIDLR